MTGARSSRRQAYAPFGISRDSRLDAHRVGSGARPELPAALGLERRGDARVRRRRTSSAATAASRERSAFLSTRAVRSAAHGATTRPRCRTSTSCFAPRRLCSARRRALPRGRRRRDLAGGPARPARTSSPAARRPTAKRRPATTCRRCTTTGSSATSSSTAARPGVDPYTFRPEAKPQPNFAGWPFGFLVLAAGRGVRARRAAGTCCSPALYVLRGPRHACAWLRELGLPRGPPLAGGLAFAIAPYRVEQSVGHLLGPISILLPLVALGLRASTSRQRLVARAVAARRSRRSRCRDRCISRSARSRSSCGYALFRNARSARSGSAPAAGAVAAIGAGLLVRADSDRAVDSGAAAARSPRSRTTRRMSATSSRGMSDTAQRAVRLPRLG